MVNEHVILLVEDNADDELLTVRAFAKSKIANKVIVVRDGIEALEWLFATGEYAGRDLSVVQLHPQAGRVRSFRRSGDEPGALLARAEPERSARNRHPLNVDGPKSPNGSSRSRTACLKPASAARRWNAKPSGV